MGIKWLLSTARIGEAGSSRKFLHVGWKGTAAD